MRYTCAMHGSEYLCEFYTFLHAGGSLLLSHQFFVSHATCTQQGAAIRSTHRTKGLRNSSCNIHLPKCTRVLQSEPHAIFMCINSRTCTYIHVHVHVWYTACYTENTCTCTCRCIYHVHVSCTCMCSCIVSVSRHVFNHIMLMYVSKPLHAPSI